MKPPMFAEDVDARIEPFTSFTRGIRSGVAFCTGLPLVCPDFMAVHEWPEWARVAMGVPFVLLGVHWLLQQRGYMVAARIVDRSERR